MSSTKLASMTSTLFLTDTISFSDLRISAPWAVNADARTSPLKPRPSPVVLEDVAVEAAICLVHCSSSMLAAVKAP